MSRPPRGTNGSVTGVRVPGAPGRFFLLEGPLDGRGLGRLNPPPLALELSVREEEVMSSG
ncbi:MAG: hypothetical protein R3B07_21860 [Polyangiaceae bacterium]